MRAIAVQLNRSGWKINRGDDEASRRCTHVEAQINSSRDHQFSFLLHLFSLSFRQFSSRQIVSIIYNQFYNIAVKFFPPPYTTSVLEFDSINFRVSEPGQISNRKKLLFPRDH